MPCEVRSILDHDCERYRENLEASVPTLYIGLGGAGKDVLMRLRRRYFDDAVCGQSEGPPRFLRCLMIDTDLRSWTPSGESPEDYPPRIEPRPEEYVNCQIGTEEFRRVFHAIRERADARFAGWLSPDMEQYGPESVRGGAGTHRQFGRLAFILYYRQIREAITKLLADILDAADRSDRGDSPVEPDSLEVVIVSSLAGGSGAGMLLDTAYLVRDILATRFQYLKWRFVTFASILPAVFRARVDNAIRQKLDANAYATLLELNRYGPGASADGFVGKLKEPSLNRDIGFVAPWEKDNVRLFDIPAYDVCHLVDCRNDLCIEPLPPGDVFQMVADSFFLDHHPTELGIRKRSTRFAPYRGAIETRVRRPKMDGGISIPNDGNRDIVYVSHNACVFSAFGQSEIRFDKARLSRAVAYRLGELVARERLLGRAEAHPANEYHKWVEEDLLSPSAHPSFALGELLHAFFSTGDGNWLDRLNEDLANVRNKPPSEGSSALQSILIRHEARLADAALKAQHGRSLPLAADLKDPSPYMRRILEAAYSRACKHGVLVALELLGQYKRALLSAAKHVEAWRKEPDPPRQQLLTRLEEADRLWPRCVRSIAQAIEFPRACSGVQDYLHSRYRQAAAPFISHGLRDVSDNIGTWLHELGPDIRSFLERLADSLRQRFDEARTPPQNDRVQILFPEHWDEAEYDRRIWKALVAAGYVSPERGPGEGFGFDSPELERQVFERLGSILSVDLRKPPPIERLQHLPREWFADDKRIGEIADAFGMVCGRFVLQEMDRSDDDTDVVELLDQIPPEMLRQRLEKLIRFGEPYLPLSRPRYAASGHRLEHVNLLGIRGSDRSPDHRSRKEKLLDEIQRLRHRVVADPNRELITADGDMSTLLLSQEALGVPAVFYADIGSLQEAYHEIHRSGAERDCHIDGTSDWPFAAGLSGASTEDLERIAENADEVVWALLQGEIYKEETGVLTVRGKSRHGIAWDTYRLGSGLNAVVYRACATEDVCRHIWETQKRWEQEATAQRRALVYAAALWSYHSAQYEIEPDTDRHTSPLRNCLGSIVPDTAQRLKLSDEGIVWYEYLARPDDAKARMRWEAEFLRLIEDGVLVRLAEHIPVYVANWSNLDRLQLP